MFESDIAEFDPIHSGKSILIIIPSIFVILAICMLVKKKRDQKEVQNEDIYERMIDDEISVWIYDKLITKYYIKILTWN